MRILLINQYAGSPELGMEFRPHWMAREWLATGHSVLVVSADWTHLRRRQLPGMLGRHDVEGVEYESIPVTRHRGNGATRFANIVSFRAGLWARSAQLKKWKPDVVIASSTHPMDVRPAASIADRSGARFVHEVHDLWPLTPILLGGTSPKHPVMRIMQREEDFACSNADLVVSILPATREYLQSRGLSPARWVHIPNGVPPEAFVESSPSGDQPGHRFRIGYFGAHGAANDLGTLLDATKLLGAGEVEVHLTGDGPEKASLVAQAAGVRNVCFHDAVDQEAARASMHSMDALYIGLAPSPLFRFGVSPNKLLDYMAAGKPIIHAIDTNSSPAIDAGCAITCEAGNPAKLAHAMEAMAAMSAPDLVRMSNAGREYARANHLQAALAESFVKAIESS